jgi:hypothetical protein
MGGRTQAAIGHEHSTRGYRRGYRLHRGELVSQEGRAHQRQEHAGAGMAPPEEGGPGKAAPRPLPGRLAAPVLEGWGIGPRTSRTIHENRAMARPPAITRGAGGGRAGDARAEEIKEAERESGAGLTVGRGAEAQARQLGQRTAGGVALENWEQEERRGRAGREQAVAPGGRPDLPAHGQEGCGWQQQGPLTGEAWQDGAKTRDPLMPSCTIRGLSPIQTGEAWRLRELPDPGPYIKQCCLT